MILGMEVRKFQSYTDMEVAHQKDIDNFPMCFIIGSKSHDEILDEIEKALGTRDLSEVMKSPYGGIIRKADLEYLELIFSNHLAERHRYWRNFDNLVDAIYTEMCNHEYGYTLDPTDTLMALGKSAKAFLDETFAKAWDKAKKRLERMAA